MTTDPADLAASGPPAPAPPAALPAAVLRDAAGPSYAGEWGLFCDYAAATGQPALPTTVAALTGFLTALPARPATLARRVRAIATAHRHAGHLLARPDHGPAASPTPRPSRRHRGETGPMIAACPTRGWPHGLHGRRDACLIVATVALGLSATAARALTPAEITPGAPPDGSADDSTVLVAGQTVPEDPDPRTCPACAVVRWLDLLGVLDGLGRGSARMDLAAAHAPLPESLHRHRPGVPERWRGAAILLPAIDQHGWLDDFRPIATRTIRTRLARAATRAALPGSESRTPPHPPEEPGPATKEKPAESAPERSSPSLDEVLTILDGVADNAEALNARIQALLDGHY